MGQLYRVAGEGARFEPLFMGVLMAPSDLDFEGIPPISDETVL